MAFIIVAMMPFLLFVGGAYMFEYPMALGVLYGFNVTIIYIVLWLLANQALKVNSQKMDIVGDKLIMYRDQLFMSFPIIRRCDLEIPLKAIRNITMISTRIGYLLTVRFQEGEKTMGLDLDLNPLNAHNRDVLNRVISQTRGLTLDEGTKEILQKYDSKAISWKSNYALSLFAIGTSLVIFFIISVMLGTGKDF